MLVLNRDRIVRLAGDPAFAWAGSLVRVRPRTVVTTDPTCGCSKTRLHQMTDQEWMAFQQDGRFWAELPRIKQQLEVDEVLVSVTDQRVRA